MPKSDFIPTADNHFLVWLDRFIAYGPNWRNRPFAVCRLTWFNGGHWVNTWH